MLSIGMTEWFSSVDQEFSLVDALWSLSSPLSVEREMRERTTPSAAKRRPLPPLLGKEGNLINPTDGVQAKRHHAFARSHRSRRSMSGEV